MDFPHSGDYRLSGYWAYYSLVRGGWWFWDPVNASRAGYSRDRNTILLPAFWRQDIANMDNYAGRCRILYVDGRYIL
jgi:hypothetical protein